MLEKPIASFAVLVCVVAFTFVIVSDNNALDIENIVGVWLFDEGAGNVVKDSSGNNHDGEAFNTNWVEGIFGKALEFEGNSDSMVKIPHFDGLNLEVFTVAAWIKVSELGGYQCIVAKDGNDPGGTLRTYGMFVIQDQAAIHYSFRDAAGTHQTTNGTAAAADGEWRHVAMAYDGAMIRGYVDAVLDIERPFSGPPITNDGPLTVGSDEVGNYFLKGIIDEVYVINSVLDEKDIAQLMSEQIQSAVEPMSKLTATWGQIKM